MCFWNKYVFYIFPYVCFLCSVVWIIASPSFFDILLLITPLVSSNYTFSIFEFLAIFLSTYFSCANFSSWIKWFIYFVVWKNVLTKLCLFDLFTTSNNTSFLFSASPSLLYSWGSQIVNKSTIRIDKTLHAVSD